VGGSRIEPATLGQPGPAFAGPVAFALVREHSREGWRCSLRLGASYFWFDGLGGAPSTSRAGAATRPPLGNPAIVVPKGGMWHEEQCGNLMTAQAEFGAPEGGWTTSHSGSVPVHF
jgi:hypothetical protein